MGACMRVRDTTATGTVIAATKFRDFLCSRYNTNPPKIQKKWRLHENLFCVSRDYLTSFRPQHSMSQWDMGRYYPPLKTSFLPSLRTRRTPNPIGPHQIWGGSASRRESPRNTGWYVNPGPMGEPAGSNRWYQVCRCWRGDLEASYNGNVSGRLG